LMGALGLAGVIGANWQSGRYSAAETYMESEKARALSEPCMIRDTQTFAEWPASQCQIPGADGAIAVWGDSFAGHYFDAFRRSAVRTGRPLILLAESSCPPIAGLDVPNRPGCADFNAGALKFLKTNRPAFVILSADWMVYEKKKTVAEMFEDKFARLTATIAELHAAGSRVVVIGPSPVFSAPVPLLAAVDDKQTVAKASYSRKFDRYFRDLAEQRLIAYLPAFELFCNDAAICRYREGERLFFWDTGHLTGPGGDLVVGRLLGEINRTLSVPPKASPP
jgi:hypothetical protein